jgi:uncharacterized protein (DUF952 family)
MRCIYHLVPAADWAKQAAGPYRVASLDSEGFIHCSNRDQVARVANLFYADQSEMVVLSIAAELLTSPLRDDDIGTGERFPHVYGPINREAIVEVTTLSRDARGKWIFDCF